MMDKWLMKNRTWIVWLCRILTGATFVVSGLAKAIDPWGFVYKIGQYLVAWDLEVSFPLIVGGAVMLSCVEFIAGFMMLTGCYRRTSTWFMLLMMAVMLPLTLYIAVANPVNDCGCFGDFIIISNTATFLKNVIITWLIVILLVYNHKVNGQFTTYSQWIVAFVAIVYVGIISLWGYNIQPLVDFRQFKIGVNISEGNQSADAPEFVFVYEKDNQTKEFTMDSLPDDSWTFVERREIEKTEKPSDDVVRHSVAVFEEDEDVTSDVILSEGKQLLLVIPELSGIDISSTYLINEMYRYALENNVDMVGLLGADSEGIDYWRDMSLADYPLYSAEDTELKELSRGVISVVYLDNGIIKWKRSLASIDSDYFSDVKGDKHLFEKLDYPSMYYFWWLTLAFGAIEIILFLIDRSGRSLKSMILRRNQKK